MSQKYIKQRRMDNKSWFTLTYEKIKCVDMCSSVNDIMNDLYSVVFEYI